MRKKIFFKTASVSKIIRQYNHSCKLYQTKNCQNEQETVKFLTRQINLRFVNFLINDIFIYTIPLYYTIFFCNCQPKWSAYAL